MAMRYDDGCERSKRAILCFVQTKYRQAEMRARLSKATSIQDALLIIKSSSKQGRHGTSDCIVWQALPRRLFCLAMITPDSLKKEQQTIRATAQQLNKGMQANRVRLGQCSFSC